MIRKALYAGTTILVGLVALAGIKARADVITTYTIQGNGTGGTATTQNGATIVGSFQIDQTTFNYKTGTGVSVPSPFTVSNDTYNVYDGMYYNRITGIPIILYGLDAYLYLVLQSGSMPETGNIPVTGYIESMVRAPIDYFSSTDYLLAKTPTSVPEPSTLAILASGVLGIVGLARRRMRIDPGQSPPTPPGTNAWGCPALR